VPHSAQESAGSRAIRQVAQNAHGVLAADRDPGRKAVEVDPDSLEFRQ
jgi:hypothetical protein